MANFETIPLENVSGFACINMENMQKQWKSVHARLMGFESSLTETDLNFVADSTSFFRRNCAKRQRVEKALKCLRCGNVQSLDETILDRETLLEAAKCLNCHHVMVKEEHFRFYGTLVDNERSLKAIVEKGITEKGIKWDSFFATGTDDAMMTL